MISGARKRCILFGSGHLAVLLATLLLLGSPTSSYAEVSTYVEAEQVCQNQLSLITMKTGGWAGEMNPAIRGYDDFYNEEGRLLGRVFHIEPKGFVIVPILKEMPPVKLYSDESNFDVNDTQGWTQLMREILTHRTDIFIDYYGSLEAAQPADGIFAEEHKLQWEKYLKSTSEFTAELGKDAMTTVGPLLDDTWDQGYPYNDLCPDGDGGQCVVGCVATSGTQIMRYWQCPPAGIGSHSYYWDGDNSCDEFAPPVGGGQLSADFSDPYDWDNMPPSQDYPYKDVEIDAVAELCYEVAVAFEMDFGYCGSGVFPSDVPTVVMPAYINNFRYDSGMDQEYRSNGYNGYTWFTYVIKPEINEGRPLQYFITGHAFVCDGWRDGSGSNEYHMNYGWGGSQNGWYVVDNYHCPDNCYQSHEFVLRYIQPQSDWDSDGVLNAEDNCPITSNADQLDEDCDGIGDACDNCMYTRNADQGDADGDGIGDYCETDADDDGILNEDDNCWLVPNADQANNDTDEFGNACDNCPNVDNPFQYDEDDDGYGDACETGLFVQCCVDMPDPYLGEPFSYQFWATGGTPPYTWEKVVGQIPYGLVLDSDGLLHGTPGYEFEYSFQIRVTDNASNTDIFSVTMDITPAPDPPEFVPMPIQNVVYDENLTFTVESSQPNGAPVLSCEDMPANSTFDDLCDGTGEFSFNPTYDQIGTHNVTFIAEDEYAADTQVVQINVKEFAYMCGDVNESASVDIDDIVYTIAYVFQGGPAPLPEESGDVNCSGGVDIDDIVYLISYVFQSGFDPCDPDNDGSPDC